MPRTRSEDRSYWRTRAVQHLQACPPPTTGSALRLSHPSASDRSCLPRIRVRRYFRSSFSNTVGSLSVLQRTTLSLSFLHRPTYLSIALTLTPDVPHVQLEPILAKRLDVKALRGHDMGYFLVGQLLKNGGLASIIETKHEDARFLRRTWNTAERPCWSWPRFNT